jgi:hypothetical protein
MKRNNGLAYLIGTGIALSPIHNLWLTSLFTSNGQVNIFLPSIGLALWFIGSLLFLTWNWQQVKTTGIGPKLIWIPLAVIVLCLGISGSVTGDSLQDKIAPFFMGCGLFSLYLASRVLGLRIFYPIAIGCAVASFGVFISAILNPGNLTGGLLFEYNYDVVVGYVLLGAACFIHKARIQLSILAVTAIMLTGSPEGIFAIVAIGICLFIRRDWNKKLLFVVCFGIVLLIALSFTGLFNYSKSIINNEINIAQSSEEEFGDRSAIGYRLWIIEKEMRDIQPFGKGYSITDFTHNPVHNVPLIIVQQLGYPGIIAGIAWLFVCFYCLVKTKWKYAWTLVIALCFFDHFMWTQLAPMIWVIAGVSSTSQDKDYIFKEVRCTN